MGFKDGKPTIPKKCKGCVYRDTSGDRTCDFILITGKSRGCSVEECNHFEPAYTGSQKRAQRAAMRKKGLA